MHMAVSGSAKICLGALLTAAAFMLQVSCVFFPVLGSFLSAACTMFIAVAAALLRRDAIIVYLSVGLLMIAINPRYAAEFLMTTGFVGLTLGMFMEKSRIFALCLSGVGMFAGLCFLTYLLGSAALGGLFTDLPISASLPVFAIFSAAYSGLWYYLLRKLLMKWIHKYWYQ